MPKAPPPRVRSKKVPKKSRRAATTEPTLADADTANLDEVKPELIEAFNKAIEKLQDAIDKRKTSIQKMQDKFECISINRSAHLLYASLLGARDNGRDDIEYDEAVSEFDEEVAVSQKEIERSERLMGIMNGMLKEMLEGFEEKHVEFLRVFLDRSEKEE